MSTEDNRQEALALRLRRARELSGLSQGQTARLLKMSRPTITEIEAGRRRVSAEEAATLAETYGVSIDWLLGRDAAATAELQLVARKLSGLSDSDIESLLDLLKTLNKERKSA